MKTTPVLVRSPDDLDPHSIIRAAIGSQGRIVYLSVS